MSKVDVDSLTDIEIRDLLKEILAERKALSNPFGEDRFSHLPIHLSPPECPLCSKFPKRMINGIQYAVCHDCNGIIPHSLHFFNNGVESKTVDHLHIKTVALMRGTAELREPARRELCLPCFRLDWAKAEPDKPCDL